MISKESDGASTVAGLNAADDFDVVAFPCLRPYGCRPRAGSVQHREVGGGDSKPGFALQRLPEGPPRGVWIDGPLCSAVPGRRLRSRRERAAMIIIGAFHEIEIELRL